MSVDDLQYDGRNRNFWLNVEMGEMFSRIFIFGVKKFTVFVLAFYFVKMRYSVKNLIVVYNDKVKS